MTLSDDILKKINDEKITPESRLSLRWKDYAYWGVIIAMSVLGALFFSLALLALVGFDRELLHDLGVGKFFFVLRSSLPIFWVLLLVFATAMGVTAFIKTRHGYRYRLVSILTILVLSISLLAFMLHLFRLNQNIADRLRTQLPYNERLLPPGEQRFHHPSYGILAGKITSIQEGSLTLETRTGDTWTVRVDEQTRIRGDGATVGSVVSVVGTAQDQNVFHAKKIGPLPRQPKRR